MERKLEKNERPRKGKKYKFVGLRKEKYYKPNKLYFCETDGFVSSEFLGKSFKWRKDFSDNFVEVIDTLSKQLTTEEIKFLSNLEEENERKLMFPETTGVNDCKSWYEQVEEDVRKKLNNKSLTLFDIDLIGEDVENKINEKIGVKHDQNKLPIYTVIFKQFPLAIQAVAKRSLAGHIKYIETDADWQNFARAGEKDPDRYKNAGMRHMSEEGEDKEEGMEGTTHEAAVVWNFLADLELKLRRDDKR